jgi:GNAT superfamily N-acetyltransferase
LNYEFRQASVADIEATIEVRGRTRQNPISRARLGALGITGKSIAESFESGRCAGFVCTADSEVIGFCNADASNGEVLVLAVLPAHEGRGVGKRLLSAAVRWLKLQGCSNIWLAADPDPATRAHGFYRSQGWRPRGETDSRGDEILELKAADC